MTICSAHLAPFFFYTNFPAEARISRDVTKDITPATKICFLLLCAAQDHDNMLAFQALLSKLPVCLWANFPPEGLPMGSIPCFHAFDTLIISGDYLSGEARSTQLWSKESRFSGSLSQVRILFCDSASRSSYFMGFYL